MIDKINKIFFDFLYSLGLLRFIIINRFFSLV